MLRAERLTKVSALGITAAMLSPALEKLLVFQDRDQRRLSLETQINHVPEEIAGVRRKVEGEKAGLETVKAAWREAESRRSVLETEIGAAEQKAARFRTQQLEVRKNDEYQALGNEIATVEAQVAALEEQEIEALYAIDEAKRQMKEAEAVWAESLVAHEGRIRLLEQKALNMREQLDGLQSELAVARSEVPDPALVAYERIAKRVPLPVCVPLRDQKCLGCHLKVSSGVASDVRSGTKIVHCDNCGRIVYWEG